MQPAIFQERESSRRGQKRLKAFVIAFAGTVIIMLFALAIWDDVPQTTSELPWDEVPAVRIWTFLLVLLGTPALTAILSTVLPWPKGRSLSYDEHGIHHPTPAGTIFRPWREIAALDFYGHPDGKSFIKITEHGRGVPKGGSQGWIFVRDPRIRDNYELPLPEIFDRLRAFHRRIAGAAAPESAEIAGSPLRVTFECDRQKLAYRPLSALILVLFLVLMALTRVFEVPGWLLWLGMAAALASIIYQLIGAFESRSPWSRQQLVLDGNGVSVVAGAGQQTWSWSQIDDIRVRGRTGFWATPRYIAVGVNAGPGPGPGQGPWGRMFGRSGFVIPDTFLTSVDEIANRLEAFRNRAGPAGA